LASRNVPSIRPKPVPTTPTPLAILFAVFKPPPSSPILLVSSFVTIQSNEI